MRKLMLIAIVVMALAVLLTVQPTFAQVTTADVDSTITVNAGTLHIRNESDSTLTFAAVSLDDYYDDPTSFSALQPTAGSLAFRVIDGRSRTATAAWQLTLESTKFLNGTDELPLGATGFRFISGGSSTITKVSGTASPTLLYPGASMVESAQTIASTTAGPTGTGIGRHDVSLTADSFQLDLNQTANPIIPNTYTATITATLVAIP